MIAAPDPWGRAAQAHAAARVNEMECHEGRMEDLPLPDGSVDVVISNGDDGGETGHMRERACPSSPWWRTAAAR